MSARFPDSMIGLPIRLAAEWRKNASIVESVRYTDHVSLRFEFRDLVEANAVPIKNQLKAEIGIKSTTIYVLHVTEEGAHLIVRDKIRLVRQAKKRAYPRDNTASSNASRTCLYVGKSESTASRLYQHLIEAPTRTYALHLSHWASDIPGGIQIEAFKFDDISRDLLQALEDHLGGELRPMLGKRGAK